MSVCVYVSVCVHVLSLMWFVNIGRLTNRNVPVGASNSMRRRPSGEFVICYQSYIVPYTKLSHFSISVIFTCVSYAEARNSYRLDVRLSVRPSVCLSVTRWHPIK